jgi:peptidoglycan/LPS O-acetylase OafA/YrhL
MSRRFGALEGLRGAAAVMVVICHGFNVWSPDGESLVQNVSERLGYLGLYLLFAVSGFVLYRPMVAARHGRPAQRWRRFWMKRLTRVFPAYWVALTGLAIYPGLDGVFTDEWWVHYFLLQNLDLDWFVNGIVPAWSLGVELTFYLALPLYALVAARSLRGLTGQARLRRELRWLGGAAVISWIVHVILYAVERETLYGNTLPGNLGWLAIGMGLALISVEGDGTTAPERVVRWVGSHPGPSWLAASAVIVASTFTEEHSLVYAADIAMTFLVFCPAVADRQVGAARILNARVAMWLGTVSYGIYIYHFTMERFFDENALVTGAPVPELAFAIVVAVSTLICAAGSWYLIERPLLRRVGSSAYRRAPREPEPSPVPEGAGRPAAAAV